MNRNLIVSIVSVVALSSAALSATAPERGTPAQARAMLQKAVAHYKAVGRTQALADFNAKKSPFGERDLYVFCIGPDNTLIANGGFPEYVGRSADEIKDSDGKSVGKAGREVATAKGEGELRYTWFNPVLLLLEPKISYFARAGSDVCGVGAYNPG
jgi:cytochrome c